MRCPSTHLVFLCLVCVPALALSSGGEGQENSDAVVGVEALTDFPLQAGVGLFTEVGHRVQFSSSIGLMPRVYLDAINDISMSAGWYDEPTAISSPEH